MAPEEREDPATTTAATQVATDDGFKDAEGNVIEDRRARDASGKLVENSPRTTITTIPAQGEGEGEGEAPPQP